MMSEKLKNRRKIINIIIARCNGDISFMEEQTQSPVSVDQIITIMDNNIAYFGKNNFVLELSEKTHIEFELQQRLVKVAEENKATALEGGRVQRWLEGNTPSWRFWKDYEELLLNQKISQEVIWDNEEVIDNCIDMSGDPAREGPWESRGLVMGNVQSGKTLNFIGLINKAMDVGYHTIIVIGGHLKELREQSQERVDEGVIGRNTRTFGVGRGNTIVVNNEPFGVAKSANGLSGRPHGGTTVHADFSKPQAGALNLNFASTEPVVFVVKKHYKLLNNLREWIEDFPDSKVRDRPMLLIDDEADYASINTKKAGEAAAATNVAIKQLLQAFTRKTYIGYTATPFANVFIPQYFGNDKKFDDDLFPRDFMASMPIPSNYCGQDYFFPEDSDEQLNAPVRKIEDKEYEGWLQLKHKKDVHVKGIPESLEDAVLCFLLVIAIRYRRGYDTAHNTMLVNVSRFNLVQLAVSEEIDIYLTKIKNAISSSGAWELERALDNPTIERLHGVYESEYNDCGFGFSDILITLALVCKKTKVSLVNGLFKQFSKDKKASPLPYSDNKEEGLWVIAVGGLKLSRGLTLEGLSVSYFLRSAAAYDTLTQMCRWYGYRPGYKELCRLWITGESEEHYYTVASAIRQLYQDLKLMKMSRGTPNDFGLRVRASDLSLLITARNKMGSAEKVTMTYNLWNSSFKQLRTFTDEAANTKNHEVIGGVISRLAESRGHSIDKNLKNSYVIRDVDYESIVEIVRSTDFPMITPRANPDPVVVALKAMSKKRLQNPNIIIFNVGKSNHPDQKHLSEDDFLLASTNFNFQGFNIGLRNRAMTCKNGHIYNKNATIGDSDDLAVLFEKDELLALAKEASEAGLKTINAFYQTKITSPVLVIYMIAALIGSKDKASGKTVVLGHKTLPTIMYSLIFPTRETMQATSGTGSLIDIPEMDKEESYYWNEVLQGTRMIDIGDEDDDDEDEDD
jgi:hypothetical protein